MKMLPVRSAEKGPPGTILKTTSITCGSHLKICKKLKQTFNSITKVIEIQIANKCDGNKAKDCNEDKPEAAAKTQHCHWVSDFKTIVQKCMATLSSVHEIPIPSLISVKDLKSLSLSLENEFPAISAILIVGFSVLLYTFL